MADTTQRGDVEVTSEGITSTIRSLSTLNLLFGIWLIISPFILSYNTSQAKWQSVVAGIIVGILALIRLGSPGQVWASWVNALIGVWLVIAPYATGYTSSAAHWNQVIFGILVAVVGFWNASVHIGETRYHHGTGSHA